MRFARSARPAIPTALAVPRPGPNVRERPIGRPPDPVPEPVTSDAFFAACAAGDRAALGALLEQDPALVRARNAAGATGLHAAVAHPEALRVLLGHGADPNAREPGDNALALHYAAAGGLLDSVRVLLDGGSDVQGEGDLHRMDAIGWATVFADPQRDVVDLLVSRGARHHVFSAIALGEHDVLRRLAADDPSALARRLSRHEQEQSALHYVVAPADGLVGGTFRTGPHYRTLDVLITLGADLEARDARGRTPLEVAMLRGDREAMRRLHAAGARLPDLPAAPDPTAAAAAAATMGAVAPMLAVPDVAATLAWYQALGFTLAGSHEDGGRVDWASVTFGAAEVMFVPAREAGHPPTRGLSLWIRAERLDELYAALKRRQLERARVELEGGAVAGPAVPIAQDLHTAFYGQREFAVLDPNGVTVNFCQPLE